MQSIAVMPRRCSPICLDDEKITLVLRRATQDSVSFILAALTKQFSRIAANQRTVTPSSTPINA
jgi:hypothetical protein